MRPLFGFPFFRPVMAIALLVGTAGRAAEAGPIAITPTLAFSEVIEGAGGVLNYLVTNVSGHPVTIAGLGFAHFPTTVDPTDDPKFLPMGGGCTLGLALAPGGNCDIAIPYTSPKSTEATEEAVPDFGLTRVRVLAGTSDGSSAVAEGLIRIDDVPINVTPPRVVVSGSTAMVFEGTGGSLSFSILNDSDNSAKIATLLFNPPQRFPDLTDDAKFGDAVNCPVGFELPAHGVCTMTVPFTTPSADGEPENADVGFTTLTLTASLDNGSTDFGTGVVEVLDKAVSVPAPNSFNLLLLGFALLALTSARRPQQSR